MDGTYNQYEVIEDDQFSKQRDALGADARRIDDMLEGVVWAVSTNPEQLFRVWENRNLWVVKTDPFPGAPRIRVYFTIRGHQVVLLWLERIETIDDEMEGEATQ